VTTTGASLRPTVGRRDVRGVELRLLGGFELALAGEPIGMPRSAQRVLAFLALQSKPVDRAYVAGTLWIDAPEVRAHASLRSSLWRIRHVCPRLVTGRGQQLRLDDDVGVDLRASMDAARQALAGEALYVHPLLLSGDLLPDWYDDWLVLERERHRQLRLHALDYLCERLVDAGRFDDALEVGLAAITTEPLRESAHRSVIRIYLAEGNAAEAIRQYHLFRRLLREQLGLEPSTLLQRLIAGLDSNVTIE
jgi:DNA-binding SARP family transcriptional activator